MSALSLVDRLAHEIRMLPADTFIETRRNLQAILADVRELHEAATFAHYHLTRDLHDVRDGNNDCQLCEAQGKLTAILAKCAKCAKCAKEST